MKQENKKISTPVADFIKTYAKSNPARFHMPGHKGISFLGCEAFDITEISGADSLYEADGVIAESEENARKIFDSQCTLFSTEGSSQCIRAMLYLAMIHARKKTGKKNTVIAARNVHKAFIYAATLLDMDVIWLWPEERISTICSCGVSEKQLESALAEHKETIAVYITSPDYLGGQADISAMAKVCHKNDVMLLVDNAHGAYLKFLEPSCHPLDLGADICCDSAHKTLPVLTGGAYLHIGKKAPRFIKEQAKYAMELFGSTSPSYLTMMSLDLCNHYLSEGYSKRLKEMVALRCRYEKQLEKAGWKIKESDPLKLTIEIPEGLSSDRFSGELREKGIYYEYADKQYLVFMLTPENTESDLERLAAGLGRNFWPYKEKKPLKIHPARQKISIRQAMLSLPETVPVQEAENRICRVPTVSCPPAIPIAVPGEVITGDLIEVFQYYGITQLDVVKEP